MESNRGSQGAACSLGPSELSQRGARWTALLARADTRVTRTGNGMRLTFAADQGTSGELRELVGLERQCCAFATWSVHENGGQLVVDIGANTAEGIAAVQAMFTG